MKELDKNLSYDLRDLNESQLQEFKRECVRQGATPVFHDGNSSDFNSAIKYSKISFIYGLFERKWGVYPGLTDSINALTLFEPELKIGDTFEYNGFVCRVESEVLVWVYNKMLESYHKECDIQEHHLVITNKEFIKQLEENAK